MTTTKTVGLLLSSIALLASLGAYQYLSNSKLRNEFLELNQLKIATQSLGASLQTPLKPSQANTPVLAGLGFFPLYRVSGAAGSQMVANQWGGSVESELGSSIGGRSLSFAYTDVPSSVCAVIASKVDGITEKVTVNGIVTKNLGGNTDLTKLISACSNKFCIESVDKKCATSVATIQYEMMM